MNEHDPNFTGGTFVHGAQRAIGLTRMIDDETGEVVTETLVLPNGIYFLYPAQGGRVLVGQSRFCSPPWSRAFLTELPGVIEHVNGCDCPMHNGRTMERLDPEAAWS